MTMREMLFRGKRVDNGEWVVGSLIALPTGEYEIGKKCVNPPDSDHMWRKILITNKVIPETIGQYTGFTTNGKKIFEGDYWIDEDNDIFVVEFRNGQYCFVIYSITGEMTPNGFDETAGGFGEVDCVPMTDYYVDEIEIVGNVHDNKELLGGGNDNG